MTTSEASSADAQVAGIEKVDMKVEVVVIPVSDVDRAKQFYRRIGWRLDVTPPIVVQLTPHGSGCSVQFGTSLTSAPPGSATAYLVVSDIEAARDALLAAGVEVSEFFHLGPDGPVPGLDPKRRSYSSRARFSDPGGNTWLLQEVTTRLPDASTPPPRRTPRSRTWQRRCAARPPRTASTRSAPARPTPIGPTGTPRTWSTNRPGTGCRRD
jgi:catechol 2,3-dioxygenase-like lactoylglutathione lyase family enzyme